MRERFVGREDLLGSTVFVQGVVQSPGASARLIAVFQKLSLKISDFSSAAKSLKSRWVGFGGGMGTDLRTPDKLEIIGYIAGSSPNILSKTENLAAYRSECKISNHQISNIVNLAFYSPFYYMTYRIDSRFVGERRQDAVVMLGMFCDVCRYCAGPKWSPDEVHLEHPPVENASDIAVAFGAPVKFNRPTNSLVFHPGKAPVPLPEADLKLFDLLQSTIIRLGMQEAPQSLVDRIRAMIRANLASGSLSLQFVSDTLSVPSWTLQRRLAEYGTTFAVLIDRMRQEMAKEYIVRRDLRIGQISELLGYSEISAFTRAFNRWYGTSPAHYRRGLG